MRRALRLFVVAGVLTVAAIGLYEAATWPDVPAVAVTNPRTTAFIERYLERERRAGRPGRAAWRWVPYARISPHLKRAVLVAEDIDFFTHQGFASGEIEQALTKAWEAGELPRGASTITQQVAKNLWLSPSYNPLRKVKEAILTRQLERHLSKRRILEIYLDIAEFGPGVYGAEAAAQRYFGVPAVSLDEHQAAQLAAGLPRPSSWHPGSSSRAYAARTRRILGRMARAQWLWKAI